MEEDITQLVDPALGLMVAAEMENTIMAATTISLQLKTESMELAAELEHGTVLVAAHLSAVRE